jgi:hypothetical protein
MATRKIPGRGNGVRAQRLSGGPGRRGCCWRCRPSPRPRRLWSRAVHPVPPPEPPPAAAPGQAKGNGLNAAGGLWHEITTSGTTAPASTSPLAGGGGY